MWDAKLQHRERFVCTLKESPSLPLKLLADFFDTGLLNGAFDLDNPSGGLSMHKSEVARAKESGQFCVIPIGVDRFAESSEGRSLSLSLTFARSRPSKS